MTSGLYAGVEVEEGRWSLVTGATGGERPPFRPPFRGENAFMMARSMTTFPIKKVDVWPLVSENVERSAEQYLQIFEIVNWKRMGSVVNGVMKGRFVKF